MESYYLEKKTYAGATTTRARGSSRPRCKDANGLAVIDRDQQRVRGRDDVDIDRARSRTRSTGCRPGTIERTCAPQNTGGCKAGGIW